MNTVGVDFDGVIHPYTEGWTGSMPADEPPIPGTMIALANLHRAGYRVVVISSRADHLEGYEGICAWLKKWSLDLYVDLVTDRKVGAVAYIDDRAVHFDGGNWADALDEVERLAAGKAE